MKSIVTSESSSLVVGPVFKTLDSRFWQVVLFALQDQSGACQGFAHIASEL